MATKSKIWGDKELQVKIANDLLSGKTYAMVIKKYNISVHTVLEIKRLHGLPVRGHSSTNSITRIKDMYLSGCNVGKISHAVNLSKSRIWEILKAQNITKKKVKDESAKRIVNCVCPGCGEKYTRIEFYTGKEPWRKYGDGCCSAQNKSRYGFSQTVPSQTY